ncbi:MAG: bifunctional aldolase/short-chain dehydrogenase, partial [Mesorhizobium sp.]
GDYKAVVRGHVETFAKDYRAYFETNDALDDVKRTMLDPMPRLTLVPGLGMFGHGRTLKEARIASNVGEMWIEAVRGAEAVGHFHPLSKADLFPLEYWSLE